MIIISDCLIELDKDSNTGFISNLTLICLQERSLTYKNMENAKVKRCQKMGHANMGQEESTAYVSAAQNGVSEELTGDRLR